MKMRKDFICGLDIGTAKLCATCGLLEPSGKIDILANQMVPAQGLESGRIVDGKKVTACIRAVIERVRKDCGIRVRRVYANMDSPDLKTRVCEGKALFKKKVKLKNNHLNMLINSAISSQVSLDRKLIHIGFRNFILDNQLDCVYPQGLWANDVRLNITIVSALIPTVRNFNNCIRDAGLILEDSVPSGCAHAQAFFRDSKPHPEEDILIDVGSGLTKLYLLKQKLIRDIVTLPLGAQGITEDIATKLKVSFDCAEQLKTKYGRIYPDDKFLAQKIIVKDNFINRIIQHNELCAIINLKVDELLDKMREALLKLGYKDEKVSKIIITGGGSIMEGFLERAENILGKPVKMGFLSTVKDSLIQARGAIYATSIGLIHFGFKNRENKSSFTGTGYNFFAPMLGRVKGLYREYF